MATFDMRKVIRLLADKGSFFEVGPLWGTDQITGFVRFNGHSLGVVASDSRHVNGGALTADGCDKLTRHIDLCDVFHIPILNLVDNPGFAVGLEHEIAGTIRKGGDAEKWRTWSASNIINKGGLRPIKKIFTDEVSVDNPDSAKLLNERGLLIAFLLDGEIDDLKEKHFELKQKFKKGESVTSTLKSIEKIIIRHETGREGDKLRARLPQD